MKIVATKEFKQEKVTEFFVTHWGTPEMVISSGVYQCDQLCGFVAIDDDGAIIGLITFIIEGNECEVISLDSVVENKGVGTILTEQVEKVAKESACQKVKLVTTNDNLHALGFYQKRGYHLIKIYSNAVDQARKKKPSIPLVADNGIPIRDEILLEKQLG